MPSIRGHHVPDTEKEAISSGNWRLMPVYLVLLNQFKDLLAPKVASDGFKQNPCTAEGIWTLAVERGGRIQVTYCNAGLVAGKSYESKFTV